MCFLSEVSGYAINALQLLLQDCDYPKGSVRGTAAGKGVINAV